MWVTTPGLKNLLKMDLRKFSFVYLVIKLIILVITLAADGSHLNNPMYLKRTKTETCTRRHTLTCMGGQTLAHSSAPTHAVWAEPGEMTKLAVSTGSTTMGNDGDKLKPCSDISVRDKV